MAATVDLSGKGMLCVMSRISRNDMLDEETFLRWYDNEHIAEIMRTSGVTSARRFVDVNPSADKPYLAMYAMDDIAFVKSDEFRGIQFKSASLPGSGVIYDLADLDVRNDRLVQVYDPRSKGKGHTRSLVLNQVELGGGISDQEFDTWFRDEVGRCGSV
ncbi:uncharacterized protein J7T54_004555 [Emericellopsis cladophorae]|uniref:Uncharacterized protein n=1 Tax=Emericellopsis cladophorae TaxID=2686198 RepID=A0A9Q0BH37_9HYPO|nr:uncharacterized protein J7T54_004555 [Emericellopsis cladophorae]KAI6784009.1 hypothetical protein J7T54_004555 [Emericellopsis cladophorae]